MKKTRSVLLLIILFQTISIQVAPTTATEEPEGTLVGGQLRGDTFWTKENNPYILHDNVIVPKGVTLNIEEGVVVDFHIWSMTIEGTLRARGTPEERIFFNISDTTLSDYTKARIRFTDESNAWRKEKSNGCLLEYVDVHCGNYTVEYGLINGGRLKLDHIAVYGSSYHIKEYHTLKTNGEVTNSLFDGVVLAVYMEEGVIKNNRFFNIKKGAAINILNGTVRNNIIDNTQRGINVKNALVLNNTITNTKICGILINNNEIPYEGPKLKPIIMENIIRDSKQDAVFISGEIKPIIRRNIIMDSLNGVYFGEYAFYNGTMPRIEYNIFYNNKNNIYIGREDPRIEINLKNNWWGTNDTEIIEGKVYHEYDEPHICYITYQPFLTSLPVTMPEIKYEYEAAAKPKEVEIGEKVTISGNVNPPLEKFMINLNCIGPDQEDFSESLTTGEDGSFSYKFTPDSLGDWEVTLIPVEDQLFVDPEPQSLEFTVTKRKSRIDDCRISPDTIQEYDEVTITGILKPRLQDEWIQVCVTNPNGVKYQDQAKTDDIGRFKHTFIPEISGNYSVDFSWQGTAEIEEVSETLTYVVQETASLKIVVKNKDGSPIQGVSVRSIFQPRGQGSLASKTDSNGTVVFSDILFGEYDLIAEKDSYKSSTISLLVYEGKTSEFESNLEISDSAISDNSQTGDTSKPAEGSIVYGLIPSIVTFVILIILYVVLKRGTGR